MATLYTIGTTQEMQDIRIALDHANGYFDAQGNRLPPGDGTTIGPPTLTADGTVGFLAMPMDQQFVVPHLGTTHNGTLIPASGDLLTQAELPPEFQDYLEAWGNPFGGGPLPPYPEKPDPWPPVEGEPPAGGSINATIEVTASVSATGTPSLDVDVTRNPPVIPPPPDPQE